MQIMLYIISYGGGSGFVVTVRFGLVENMYDLVSGYFAAVLMCVAFSV